ncbi:undecaprenyl-diphosphate phosphatase [Natrinema sp. H-ect4]|uniref:undecaprenyl-diphosphate phosphatase n=1 Tax=Natrinema sp. H-ect4 TaxID=3242699 RepID=UPI0035A8A7DC
MDREFLIALIAGVFQGIFEWLPISSEGNVAVVLSVLGSSPETVVAFALFLHLGTALSATVYYRHDLWDLLTLLPVWRADTRFDGEQAVLTFLAIGTLVSGAVGITTYVLLIDLFSRLTGGVLVTLIGAFLVLTGGFQYVSHADPGGRRTTPDGIDAVLVGVAQGSAILPGVSRSGVTTGTLLLRGHDGTQSFRLSFLLSIPASVGGGLLAYSDSGLDISILAAAVALGAAAVVGYATIGTLLRIVDELPFWGVCIGLGMLAILSGLMIV